MPRRLGAYRLLDRIGEGGMGVVYLARGPGHRTVALKVLRSSVAGDPTARRRLAREVETMQRVRSPYVAEVIDADLAGNTPYIVTRYVPGRTLEEVVGEGGPLAGQQLASLACGLAEALVAVHAAGVVHRDVKPNNVMLMKGTPVVIDFGIAQGPDATRLTLTGMFMGTPGYLAPEVIEGRPSSEASDVHAWGATVAFAATGRPPYGTGPYEGIFYRIVNGQPDLAGAPVPLLPLLAGALAIQPSIRPSAAQLSAHAAALDPCSLVPAPVSPWGDGLAAGAAGASLTRADAAPGAIGPGSFAPGAVAPGPLTPGPSGHDWVAPGPAGPGAFAPAAGAGVPAASPNGQPVVARPAGLAGVDPAVTALPLGDGQAAGAFGVPGEQGTAGGVAGAAVGAQAGAAAPAAFPSPLAPATRPLSARHPLPEDLADVLTPVRFEPAARPAQPPAPGTPAAAAAVPAARGRQAAAGRSRHLPVLVFASMVLLASISVIMPIAGTLSALGLIVLLRTAAFAQRRTAVRRSARGTRPTDLLVSVIAMPWFIFRALLALILLTPFAVAAAAVAAGVAVAVAPTTWPARAIAFGAGALVAFYGLGPGSGTARRQLGRVFTAMTNTRTAQLVAVAGAVALAVAAFAAAVSWPSLYWPTPASGGFIHIGVLHLGPLRSAGLLRRTGFLHRIILLRHLLRWPSGWLSQLAALPGQAARHLGVLHHLVGILRS